MGKHEKPIQRHTEQTDKFVFTYETLYQKYLHSGETFSLLNTADIDHLLQDMKKKNGAQFSALSQKQQRLKETDQTAETMFPFRLEVITEYAKTCIRPAASIRLLPFLDRAGNETENRSFIVFPVAIKPIAKLPHYETKETFVDKFRAPRE